MVVVEYMPRPTLTSPLGQRDRVFACLQSPQTPVTSNHPATAHIQTMSSLLDLALNSDAAAPTPSSQFGGNDARTPQSSRPPGATPGALSDVEGDPDDEIIGARVPGRRTNAPRTDIPKVVDVTGETLSMRFQEFLEK